MINIKSFCVFLLIFLSVKTYAQVINKDLNVVINKGSIEDLVQQIESKTDYRFFYEKSLFDTLTVTLNYENISIENLIDKAFKETNINFFIKNKSVFLIKDKAIITYLPSQYGTDVNKMFFNDKAKTLEIIEEKPKTSINSEYKLITIGTKSNKEKLTIAGNIINKNTAEPISGVAISSDDAKLKAITDGFGFYSLTLPKGKHTLNIRAIGFKDSKRQVFLQGDGKLNIEIEEQVFALKEVVISSEKASNIKNFQMGVVKLDIKDIKQVPSVFGETDVLRVVLTLPGVKSVGESSTGFNVRGGSVDQNLILFNDATIYNPSHFFGFFSAFNADVIKDVQLHKSSIPAKYGGRLSSVLELNAREGNKKEFVGTAGLGLITSRLSLEGPIVKEKTSFLFAGRTTYSNWIMNLLPTEAAYKGAKANFYDINFNVNHVHNDKNSFYLTSYLSNDNSDLASDTTFQYGNQNLALKWKHTFNNKLYGVFFVGNDRFNYTNYSNYKEELDYKLKFNISQTNVKSSFSYYPFSGLNIDFGTSSIFYINKPGSLRPYNGNSLVLANTLQKEQALENAFFLEQQYNLTDYLTINTGLRYSIYNYLGPSTVNIYAQGLAKNNYNLVDEKEYQKGDIIQTYHGPEYRLAARLITSSNSSVKISFNSQRQFLHLLSNTTSVSPMDVWKLSDKNILPQKGNQLSLGFYQNFKSNTIETSIEGYYKKINDFLDYKSGATLILNHKIEQDVLPTLGKAYGIEFLIKKQTGKVNGWLSYTYSKTLLKTEDKTGENSINDGLYYPANYDKPHDFTFIGNYRYSHRFSASLNLTYSTGRPITLPIGKYYYEGGGRVLYSDRNQYRIPDYFRSDISINILGNHKIKQLTHNSWTLGVYNLTGRKNVFSTFFASENRQINGYQLSIFGTAIPFVNYNIRFK